MTNVRNLICTFKTQFIVIAFALSSQLSAEWDALNMTKGATEISREVYDLHMLIFWICVAIGVLVFGVMFYSMYAYTKKKNPVASTIKFDAKLSSTSKHPKLP